METEKKNDFINFNGIDKKFVHENEKDGKKFYSVGILVTNEMSRNGVANITLTEKQYEAFVHETKSDSSKVNVGLPAGNETIQVSVCKFNDSENKANNKYEKKEVKLTELQSAHIEKLKSLKDRAAEAEQSGPDLD